MDTLEPINLLFSLDKNCFDGLLITILSIAKTTEHPLNILVATGSFKNKKKTFFAFEQSQVDKIENIIRKYNNENRITLIDMTDLFQSKLGKSVNLHSKFSPYSMIRLLSDLEPSFPDRLLYLDIDIVVVKDIYQVFSYDLKGKEIGMVKDEVGSHWLGKNYCNTGVILMDIKKLRETHHFDAVRYKVNHNRYFMPDQTAINRAMKKYKMIMPGEFNSQHELSDDTVIRHYCQWIRIHKHGIGNVAKKPWNVKEFRAFYGENTHKELLDEFLAIKEQDKKEQQ